MSIQVGQPAPEFKAQAVVGESFKEISLSDYKGKWLCLFFYPLDFTFVCPTEIIAFSDKIAQFKEIGAEVLGASIDSQFSHLAWKNTSRKEGGIGQIEYPLLADVTKQISADYGVLLAGGIAARGLFIIDPNGIVQSYTVNNLPVGRNVDEALRLIKGYQFVAANGEVCPANWEEGSKTMKPDPIGSKEYFQSANA